MHGAAREKTKLIPKPTPFCPDAPTFLSLIGRKMSAHASKFSSWGELFGASSAQLRTMGIEPARSRRYLLMWRDNFRRGKFGIGGDMQSIVDGVGEVRVRQDPDGKRVAVNTTPGNEEGLESAPAVGSVKVKGVGSGTIAGSYFTPVKGTMGSVAQIKIQEGLWEVKRGRKIHGGERRRKNVLSRIAAKARGTLT